MPYGELKSQSEADIILAKSQVIVNKPEKIKNKRVLIVEDGPGLTHGDMSYGAGMIAAKMHNAGEIIDPRPNAKGSIKDTFLKYPHDETFLSRLTEKDAITYLLQSFFIRISG